MNQYDYVIVGGGSAGCVLARRLSDSGRHSVLLIEAGGYDTSPWIRIPVGYARTFHDPRFNWMYRAEADPGLGARTAHWPRGKVLGGSSSINAMVFLRGQPSDYDDWGAAGNPGWSWPDVLPYFKKLEDHSLGPSAHHGTGGPVRVQVPSSNVHPLCSAFIAACGELGITHTPDFNGDHSEGAGLWQVNIRNGVRESSARAYLRPLRARTNLALMLNAHVLRVHFLGRRATGVEYVHDGQHHHVGARREVILSAGAIGSPQLLEVSGIGDPERLGAFAIPIVAAVRAVGESLQDHIGVSYFYRSHVATLNDELRPLLGKMKAALRYALWHHGPLAMSVNQAGAIVRTRAGLSRPNLHIYFNPASYSTHTEEGNRRLLNPDPFPGFLMSFNACRPTSRGSVHLCSHDARVPPAIQPNSLSTPEDIAEVYEGARIIREIAGATPLARVIAAEQLPGAHVKTDAQVLEDFRARASSVFHACGTCAMGTDPRRCVVDPRLRVHGIHGLRVVDASVFPSITSGNTNAPVMMIAEKAADLILADGKMGQE